MTSVCQTLLAPPAEIEGLYPLSPTAAETVHRGRSHSVKILRKEEGRLALLIGPCSIHDPEEALEYGKRLAELQGKVASSFFLIMRVFVEKPRTRLGWKGMLYDPYLDGSNDLQEGVHRSRKLLLELNELGVPCATEFLEPLVAPYLSDLIAWGIIGARTGASQPHRQLVSGLPFPVGFKNGVHGDLDTPISSILAARIPHSHFGIDRDGRIASVQTTGNPLAHLILRGSAQGPNCEPASVQEALRFLREHHLEEKLLIDCSHGNSGKDFQRQKWAFETALKQKNPAIRGLMLESNLRAGKQPLNEPRPKGRGMIWEEFETPPKFGCELPGPKGPGFRRPDEEPDQLQYGISITDPCLNWEETEDLILRARQWIKR
ncbi:MAG: 3-deoxy-7-phosphoheptulonate synthase [Verrucomicrobiota bacterium]|nr:3-deoxy-7-phosphoheptulonate synthase [Verrucomicrobiota bacterium]